MKKNTKNEKLEKMNIEAITIEKNEEDKKETKKSTKKNATKSKSVNKIFIKEEEIKKLEEKPEIKLIHYNLDFIFRRERYILKNLLSNILVSKLKKIISKKISVEIESALN